MAQNKELPSSQYLYPEFPLVYRSSESSAQVEQSLALSGSDARRRELATSQMATKNTSEGAFDGNKNVNPTYYYDEINGRRANGANSNAQS